MKQFFFILFNICLFTVNIWGQSALNYWTPIQETNIPKDKQVKREVLPKDYTLYRLDIKALQKQLQSLDEPQKSLDKAISLPLIDGQFAEFEVKYAPVMAPALAKKFPNIRSFTGRSLTKEVLNARFNYGTDGFHATINTTSGKIYIDPFYKGQTEYYMVYYYKNYAPQHFPNIKCDAGHEKHDDHDGAYIPHIQSRSTQVELKKYRLALACTGEYAALNGNSADMVLSSMVEALNRMNEIYELETAITFELISENDQLIFLDAATDPYMNADDPRELQGENTAALAQVGIDASMYDVGHVFTGTCMWPGLGTVGTASKSSVCTENKGNGATCFFTDDIESIIVGVMAHEIGHQFSADHTWSNCPPSNDTPGQFHASSAMEPGSGSTIMAYGGSCGNQNVTINNSAYFHARSLEQIIGFSRNNGQDGAACGTLIAFDNNEPALNLNYANGFYIPISTPFQLSANATDEDGDQLTYCWEQYDAGPISDLGNPFGNAPIFRSYEPNTSPTRIFPKIGTIAGNFSDNTEVLPTYNRSLNFRCTVRDNHPGAAGVVWEQVNFNADESAGPFLVTTGNEDGVTWTGGSYQTITWDVANTDNGRVNCQFVNILLSTNGGFVFTETLLMNTPNDGEATVFIPNVETSRARIKVEAADNIFFDMSNKNITITPATEGYALDLTTDFQEVCLPNELALPVKVVGLGDSTEPVTLEALNIPAEGVASFSQNPVAPGESTTLVVQFPAGLNINQLDSLTIQVGEESRTVYLGLVGNDYSDLALTNPVNGAGNQSGAPVFEWTAAQSALSYTIEVSDTPDFSNIVASAANLTSPQYQPDFLLEDNTIYFWRVAGENECGRSEFSTPAAFQTAAVVCTTYEPTDVPLNITGSGLPTVSSIIQVNETGSINDINIPNITGSYQPVNSMQISLVSPSGTSAVLFNQNCGTTTKFDIGFDDDAPKDVECPPQNAAVNKPIEALSIFNGEALTGNWTLEMKVVRSGFGDGGRLDNWSVEFCSELSVNSPFLVTNEGLITPPNERSQIIQEVLEVQDQDNLSGELTYTLLSVPSTGTLYRYEMPLEVGDQFRQSDINGFGISYDNNGSTDQDGFAFIVEDGTGGWYGVDYFDITIDAAAIVNTVDIDLMKQVQIFPNPTNGLFYLAFEQPLANELDFHLYDMLGQRLVSQKVAKQTTKHIVTVQQLPKGVYFAVLESDKGIFSQQIIVQ